MTSDPVLGGQTDEPLAQATTTDAAGQKDKGQGSNPDLSVHSASPSTLPSSQMSDLRWDDEEARHDDVTNNGRPIPAEHHQRPPPTATSRDSGVEVSRRPQMIIGEEG